MGVEKVGTRGRFSGGPGIAERLSMFGSSAYAGTVCWCTQESGQPLDVLCGGSQEELLLDELQPAKAKAIKADAALKLCE